MEYFLERSIVNFRIEKARHIHNLTLANSYLEMNNFWYFVQAVHLQYNTDLSLKIEV